MHSLPAKPIRNLEELSRPEGLRRRRGVRPPLRPVRGGYPGRSGPPDDPDPVDGALLVPHQDPPFRRVSRQRHLAPRDALLNVKSRFERSGAGAGGILTGEQKAAAGEAGVRAIEFYRAQTGPVVQAFV